MERTKRTYITESPKAAERVLESNIADFERRGAELSQKIQHTIGTVTDIADRMKAPARKVEEIKQHPESYLVALNGGLLLYMFIRWLRT
jgi:hypothetical protein